MVVVADVGLWCRGGDGQRAVGMVMVDVGLFDYFLMGLKLGLWVFFGLFVPGYLVDFWSWWLLCGGDWVFL